MKFDDASQQAVSHLVADSLGCQLMAYRGRLAIPDNGRFPDRDPSIKANAHQLEIKLGLKASAPPAAVALLFNSVPDRVYHKSFHAIDSSLLGLIERVNAFMQDRMAEPTDDEVSCVLFLPEIDKQPDTFPLQFLVVGDFYF